MESQLKIWKMEKKEEEEDEVIQPWRNTKDQKQVPSYCKLFNFQLSVISYLL